MRRSACALLAALLVASIALTVAPKSSPAQTVSTSAELKKYTVTIRRFDPTQGPSTGQLFVLPVDSPDEEHAAASTLANTVSFSKKTDRGRVLPVAFMVVDVSPRP